MRLLTSLTALLLCLPSSFAASLLAIDYGTDGFKAALVKPGVPFDVLINKDSKRKTPSIVALRGEDRSFGGEAANLATRFPKDTLQAVKLLLGHPSTHPQALLHASLYSNPPSTTPRGSPAIASSSGSFPVEEVLAMQFGYAKEMAEGVAGEQVREAVVTVPGWFGQSERAAVLDALELAGLRSIGLVNDGTAAAVNYAMTRTFPPTPSHHLLYDFGAGSLRTTLVSLSSALLPDPLSLAAKPELKNVTSLVVHGMGFDAHVGGLVFDGIVRDLLREDFEKAEPGKKVEGDARAMAKLLKEAGRVKQVLSANGESVSRIEGLVDDIDFRTTLSREQFERRAAHLVPRFTQPINDALADANLTINDIESVILVGGSSRVPMVEAAVRAVVGEDRIAKNVNADEAAVMGAALYGAGITRGFRTKDIRVQDVTPYGIDVVYDADKSSEDAEPRRITTHLFPALSKVGVKKTMTFKKAGDFAIQFNYRKTGVHADAEQPDSIFETTITGLTAAFENLTTEAVANATVKVTVELNESNIVSVKKAVVVLREDAEGEAGAPTLNDKLKGYLPNWGGGAKPTPKDDATTTPEADAEAPKVDDPFADLNATTRAKLDELLRLAGQANSTVKLTTATVPLERVPMSAEEKTDARKRLREVKAAETRKLVRAEARNVLEAFIYRARDLVEDPAFVASSLESERKVIKEKTEAANEWLWDEADQASTKELKAKKTELEKLVKHVSVRAAEATQRPRATEAFQAVLFGGDAFATSARTNTTLSEQRSEPAKYTTAEIDALAKLVSDAQEWYAVVVKKQEALKAWEDPLLRVADLERKAKEIEAEVGKLRRKKAPRKAKVPAAASAASAASSSSPVAESQSTSTSSNASTETEAAPRAEATHTLPVERTKDEL